MYKQDDIQILQMESGDDRARIEQLYALIGNLQSQITSLEARVSAHEAAYP